MTFSEDLAEIQIPGKKKSVKAAKRKKNYGGSNEIGKYRSEKNIGIKKRSVQAPLAILVPDCPVIHREEN